MPENSYLTHIYDIKTKYTKPNNRHIDKITPIEKLLKLISSFCHTGFFAHVYNACQAHREIC